MLGYVAQRAIRGILSLTLFSVLVFACLFHWAELGPMQGHQYKLEAGWIIY